MKRVDVIAVAVVTAALGFLVHATIGAFRLDLAHVAKSTRAVDPGFPRDVVLRDGKTFRVEAKPQRVVAASARLIDFCAALLEPERLAGFPEQAIEYTTLGDREATFRGRPRFREYLAEPVMELEPDLVLADPWSAADTKERLIDAGIPVLVVGDSVTWKEMCDVLAMLGRLFGEEDRATEEIAAIEARVTRLADRAARAGARSMRAVPYSNFGSQGFSAGSRTTLDEAMRLAGIENLVASDGIRGNVNFTFEQLITFDPDAILVSLPLRAELGHTGDKGGASEVLLCGEEMLADLRAVRERRFLRLPAGLYASSSHGIVRAAEELADERDRLLAEDAAR